jgi:uncharacterized protein YfkK (UPF0435 family)
MADEIREKIDQYNEMLLKNTALTFSSEGISRDIKVLISKKAEFVSDMLTGLAAVIDASSSHKVSSRRAKLFDEMLDHALLEVRMVNSTLNYLVAKQFEKEASFIQVEPEKGVADKAKKGKTGK